MLLVVSMALSFVPASAFAALYDLGHILVVECCHNISPSLKIEIYHNGTVVACFKSKRLIYHLESVEFCSFVYVVSINVVDGALVIISEFLHGTLIDSKII